TGIKDSNGQRKEIWCINEIQKAASGLILVSKTEEIRDLLMEEYRNNKIQVIMRVLCHGFVANADMSVLFDTDANKKETDAEPIDLKDVLKQVTVVSHTPSNNAQYISRLDLDLCTPLSSITLRKLFYFHSKHPIIGNSKFTKPLRLSDKGLCASLIALSFSHPTSKKMISLHEEEPAKFRIMCDREAKFFKTRIEREEEEIMKSGIVDLERRKDGELLAYLLGQKEFCGHTFKVTKDCLIPRASSETLVRAALSSSTRKEGAFKIIDVGTGCGNILISILKELPLATGVGIDISEAAIAVAKENSARLLGDLVEKDDTKDSNSNCGRVEWRVQDMTSLHSHGDGTSDSNAYDLLVCNPPYLDYDKVSKKKDQMIVLEQEPAVALFAKNKGYEWYQVLHAVAPELVKESGFVVLECGKDMMKGVLATWFDWEPYQICKDSQGWDRCLVLRKKKKKTTA
ncbi:S-adenosyl-L-methionine-dependent methyltransferase, partial [Mycotypha africana]|uniref:S-adenosyl-L-methionine-dependent methyltransferase n=1 Tax=Mycotypha africana TaxID=64632 RepID=UPI002301B211